MDRLRTKHGASHIQHGNGDVYEFNIGDNILVITYHFPTRIADMWLIYSGQDCDIEEIELSNNCTYEQVVKVKEALENCI